MSGVEQNIRDASGGNDPAALRDAAVASVRAAITGDQAKAEEARNRAADAIAKAQNIPVDQAKQQVAQYEQQYKDAVAKAKQQATEAAQTAATAFSAAAILAFISRSVRLPPGSAVPSARRMSSAMKTSTSRVNSLNH